MNTTRLKKIRRMDWRELHERSRQELARLRERIGGAGELSNEQLQREYKSFLRFDTAEETAWQTAVRLHRSFQPGGTATVRPTFFPTPAFRAEIVRLMQSRFPLERRAIIDRADRALTGRFDLLGLQDVSFGEPIDWHLEPLTGRRAPLVHWSRVDYLNPAAVGDKKIIWELNRHSHFVTFGQAYWLTGDEKYAEAFVAQATAWMDANPPGRGINWASSLEVSFRAMAWLWAWHLLAGSAALSPAFVLRLMKFLIAHGSHIETYLSRYFSPNTHLTGEALGLLYLGTALTELQRSSEWCDLGYRVLLEQMPVQVRADGVYFEQASYYHRYTADFYTHLVALARVRDVHLPDVVEERLKLMLDHLMWITRPDGTTPLTGDDDGGRLIHFAARAADDFRDTLATGAALFKRSDWKYVAGEAAVETLWLLGPRGLSHYDAIEPEPPRHHSRAFPDGGCYVLRDGWSPVAGYALIDGGPHGAGSCGHAHADALSLEFAADGFNWLIDPGTFTYTGDPQLRDQFRLTAAHNTVTVDDEPQSVPAGPFAWQQVAQSQVSEFIATGSIIYFEGSHNGYERLADPVTHTRSVLFIKANRATGQLPYLVVRDSFKARGRHRYALRYHFPVGVRARATGSSVQAFAPRGHRLNLNVHGAGQMLARIEQGEVSRAYAQRATAPVAVFEAEAVGPVEFVTVIVPSISPCKRRSRERF